MPARMPPERPRPWFPAKTYGLGWSWPATWQGWLVLAGYCVLLPVAVLIFPPERSLPRFLVSVFGLSAGLVAICWWKGEPLRWRWGRK